MFTEKDFWIPNISNIPNDKEKLGQLVSIFKLNRYSLQEMYNLNFHTQLKLSKETFRKRINHSTLVGILSYDDQKYELSEVSKKLLQNQISQNGFIEEIILKSLPLNNVVSITLILVKLFAPSLRIKTLYSIFSLVSKDRSDNSAISSTGRNLRAILSLIKMLGIIEKKNELILLGDRDGSGITNFQIESLQDYFNEDIVNINLIKNYLLNYFDKESASKILTCVASYETENYIWSKSSLYKNQGEVKNLFNEYIMTVIIKRG
ncbi:hypothetical protein [Fictibacillus sp. BK138]|uniref:hypothetical protein n=1 Tax=Fictibacillus sp. BK138 TaxID=2512121 RepID=UPI001029F9A5|nr:hypothetical protein [Fictibacillus sp. BK138]RZT23600.1 hypothetical protein EV282_2693 [Fictibacillus sp. BK138]